MSEYGISVARSAGKIQIDSNYKNFSIYDYGEVTKAGGAHYAGFPIYENTLGYTLDSFPWIIFNIGDTDTDTIHTYIGTVQGVSWSAVHQAYTYARVVTGQGAMQVPWAVLAPPYKPRERYGLEIYNPAGESVFTSWEPYAEIVGVHEFTLAAGGTSTFNTTQVTVKNAYNNYFHITNNNYKWYHNWAIHATDTIHYYTMGMALENSTTVEIGSAVPCGTKYWSSVPSYIEGNCWTNVSQLIELAPVRNLI